VSEVSDFASATPIIFLRFAVCETTVTCRTAVNAVLTILSPRQPTCCGVRVREFLPRRVPPFAESLGKWRNPETLSQEHPALPRAYASADVRTLIDERLPANYRAKQTWQYLSKLLTDAAQGETDAVDVEVAL
jgi:hypothetical protein